MDPGASTAQASETRGRGPKVWLNRRQARLRRRSDTGRECPEWAGNSKGGLTDRKTTFHHPADGEYRLPGKLQPNTETHT
eukprot:5789094-Pyramimonas_sp.AAC.1